MIEKCLVFRDSFFTRLTRYLAPVFSDFQLYSSTYGTFDPVKIEQERPQLVIDQFVERNLRQPSVQDIRAMRYMKARLR